jgi:L-iditol 2-dehydrogenase
MLTVSLAAPETLQLVEKEESPPQADQIRIRVKAAGIGGTDIRIFKGIVSAKLPLVLGQEFAGVVDKVGEKAKGFSVGDRAAIEPIVRDNTCEFCKKGQYTLCENLKVFGIHLDGGYSESICVPQYTVHKLPDRLSFEEGALVVPAAVALYAISRAGPIKGASVAVIGAGPIGLCAVQLAKLEGAAKVVAVDPLEARRSFATMSGASQAVDSNQSGVTAALNESTGGKGFDAVIEASGNQDSVDMVLSCARKSGTVVFAGAFGKPSQVNMAGIVRKDLTVRGSWLYPNKYDEALRLAKEGKIKLAGMASQRFKLSEAKNAFETAQRPETIKVLFTNQQDP